MRIGFGYDIHRLVEGRELVLGGAKIPFEKGLLGHSDGDVLCHAIGDAILGASCKGDIGKHFPDTDPKYKGISSLLILKEIMDITMAKVINVDSVIVCEKPKLFQYIPLMQRNLEFILHTKKISIKAKTNERIGTIGKGEAISSYTAILIE